MKIFGGEVKSFYNISIAQKIIEFAEDKFNETIDIWALKKFYWLKKIC